MHDQLIGYLLNALDDQERGEVERLLEGNAEARRVLELLRKGLTPLQLERDECAPPQGLASKTCQRLRNLYAGGR